VINIVSSTELDESGIMGYVFDFQDARSYADWVNGQQNKWADDLERSLMMNLLKPADGESVLNIGCGTGHSTLPLLQMNLSATGIDPSPYMLDIAFETLGNHVELFRGFAEDLPFDDNSFNHAFFFISLEFVENPAKALAEACRVAKDKVFIGFINRHAIKYLQLRFQGLFHTSIYNHAHFFSIWELKRMVRALMGPVPINWRTVCQLPRIPGKVRWSLEKSGLVQRCPFGTFCGMVATLVPRLRTRPLALRYDAENKRALVTGSAQIRPTNQADKAGNEWREPAVAE
jgi:SAM-dependent methyltransferase